MKVLFISSWYPTQSNPNYGIFVKEHAKAIQTTGTEIVVLAIITAHSKALFNISGKVYVDESNIKTVEVVLSSRFRSLLHYFVPLQNLIAYRYYKKHILSNFRADIVHSNVVFPAGVIGNYLASKINKPHIVTEHWSKIEGILQMPILSKLVKNAYKNASKILPVSFFLQNNMSRLMPFLPENKFAIVPNVIDDRIFKFKQKANSQELRFCAIATWATKNIPDKKPELFIEALAKVQQKISKKITLTMVGGGNRVNELKELCSKQPYKTVFTGIKTKTEISDILHQSDFFIHASTIETFGVVIVEALMTGTPVICSNVAALPELINSANGTLCENTLQNWVDGILKTLDAEYNRAQIAENVKAKYSLEKTGEAIKLIYSQVAPQTTLNNNFKQLI